MLDAVEKAGVFHGYLEDLVYTPKTLKALQSVRAGAIGRVLWTRSREAHPGPHSDWFWTKEMSGGGALVDMGCHCIEIGRSFVGKDVRPVEAVCWGATQVHPIEAEDSVVGLVRYASGAVAQFEAAWTFRGGMDLRDEVSGSDGTIWLNHWLRTGFEMFSAPGAGGYVAEKAEAESGWLFPVGDEPSALGYDAMFADMLDAFDAEARAGRDVLRRLRRERDHGRLLPLDGDEAVGAGRRSTTGAGRRRRSPRARTSSTTPGTGSSRPSGCRTGAGSSS